MEESADAASRCLEADRSLGAPLHEQTCRHFVASIGPSGLQRSNKELLLAPFAPRLVVEAALRCGAHARALQFLEEDLIDQAEWLSPF